MYIAMWNTAGELPEMDPEVVENWAEAKWAVLEELEARADDDEDGESEDSEDIYTGIVQVKEITTPRDFALEIAGMVYSVTEVCQP